MVKKCEVGTIKRLIKQLINIPIIFISKNLNLDKILENKRLAEFRNLSTFSSSARVTANSRCINHSQDKSKIIISDWALIDGILECYEKGRIYVGDYTFIGKSRIFSANSVHIGRAVLLSDNVCIMDSDLHPYSASKRLEIAKLWTEGQFPDVYTNIASKPVRIEDHVWIGFNCSILKGVTIGEGAIVGAGSVVTKDVPPFTIVAGNPARIIRTIPNEEH